jgi:TonB family protein
MKKYKSHIIAALGTVLLMALTILLLWFLQLRYSAPVEDEGIVVTFGYDEDGAGNQDASSLDSDDQQQVAKMPTQPTRVTPSSNDLMVQDSEKSLALNKKTKEQQSSSEDEVLLRKKREQEALAEAQRLEKEKLLAEQKARQQEAINKANQMGGLFGGTNSGGANGNAGNSAGQKKANPVGKGSGSVGGNTWELSNRDCKHLPTPAQKFQQDGKVVVNIEVDKDGNVISAKNGPGSTVSDAETLQLAFNAARKAKFTPGEGTQRGKITYIFKFN